MDFRAYYDRKRKEENKLKQLKEDLRRLERSPISNKREIELLSDIISEYEYESMSERELIGDM